MFKHVLPQQHYACLLWLSHVSYDWVMSLMYESCLLWLSHVSMIVLPQQNYACFMSFYIMVLISFLFVSWRNDGLYVMMVYMSNMCCHNRIMLHVILLYHGNDIISFYLSADRMMVYIILLIAFKHALSQQNDSLHVKHSICNTFICKIFNM